DFRRNLIEYRRSCRQDAFRIRSGHQACSHLGRDEPAAALLGALNRNQAAPGPVAAHGSQRTAPATTQGLNGQGVPDTSLPDRGQSMAITDINVVLVHGAWADGSSWSKVIGALNAAKMQVVAAPLPLTTLADDVAAVDRLLERLAGPVVLVGHAYGGAVI